MWRIRSLVIGIIIVAIGVAAGFMVVPLPSKITDPAFRPATAMNLVLAVLTVGASWLFYLGLKGFKTAFRQSYALLCVGLLMRAVGVVALSLLTLILANTGLLDRVESFMSFISDPLAFMGSLLIYLGMFSFSRLLGLRTWLNRIWLTIGIGVVSAGVAWAVLHTAPLLWLEALYALFAILLIGTLRANASPVYTRALTWMQVAMIVAWLSSLVFLARAVLLPALGEGPLYGAVGLLYAASIILFLVAGSSFNRITRLEPVAPEQTASFDVIVYTAALCSQPTAVDPILDVFREVTASYKPGSPLAAADIEKLKRVYRDLEDYLTQREPLRNFTVRDIRRLIQHNFPTTTWQLFFPEEQAI